MSYAREMKLIYKTIDDNRLYEIEGKQRRAKEKKDLETWNVLDEQKKQILCEGEKRQNACEAPEEYAKASEKRMPIVQWDDLEDSIKRKRLTKFFEKRNVPAGERDTILKSILKKGAEFCVRYDAASREINDITKAKNSKKKKAINK